MRYSSLKDFLSDAPSALAKGPIALIMVEDEVEVDSTVRHHLDLGFKKVVLFADPDIEVSPKVETKTIRVDLDMRGEHALTTAVNACIEAAPNVWMYYCYNAEYLFYPFCETRTIGEMLSFHTEERRDAMLTYVVDLYAGDLGKYPSAVSVDEAMLDKTGYYALARNDPANHNHPKERQLDFYGGLRWRYEEFIPAAKRRIDRIAIFRAQKGLRLNDDHTFNVAEYNTYACPWHHNLTAAICSFRTAKALKRNPGSTFAINTFEWRNSVPFDWHSRQLLDFGLIEPGQWF
ncbi:glycosyltransferase family 2 protein [Marivivens donghaensis]|jgi:hypothetical protein|uniref:glycosyltransferase family 2 protein n=1 Tax=Marivivens donghaensis TaxID=1699413 RepID=UPI003F695827